MVVVVMTTTQNVKKSSNHPKRSLRTTAVKATVLPTNIGSPVNIALLFLAACSFFWLMSTPTVVIDNFVLAVCCLWCQKIVLAFFFLQFLTKNVALRRRELAWMVHSQQKVTGGHIMIALARAIFLPIKCQWIWMHSDVNGNKHQNLKKEKIQKHLETKCNFVSQNQKNLDVSECFL